MGPALTAPHSPRPPRAQAAAVQKKADNYKGAPPPGPRCVTHLPTGSPVPTNSLCVEKVCGAAQ